VQEDHLQEMAENSNQQDNVALGNQSEAIVTNISNRVHWMREHLKDTIENQLFVVDLPKEEITPVPGIILDGIMSIHFNPVIKQDQDRPTDDSRRGQPTRLVLDKLVVVIDAARIHDTDKGSEIQHQDQVHKLSENQPSVELNRVCVDIVTLASLALDLTLHQSRQQPFVLSIKQLVLCRPLHQQVVI
jgi:hypothetical protein